MPKLPTLDDLRRYAVARTLFKPTTLLRAIEKLGFVQADPIRAPARAQDLTLRHRVVGYRAGDLERRYAKLAVEEDCLVNYGFLPRKHLALMHPRTARAHLGRGHEAEGGGAAGLHPRERPDPSARRAGALRARPPDQCLGRQLPGDDAPARRHALSRPAARRPARERHPHLRGRGASSGRHQPAARAERAAALLELVLRKYAPLPGTSFRYLTYLLGYGAPHLAKESRTALKAAREQFATVRIDGVDWYWPADENPRSSRYAPDEAGAPARALRPDRLGPAPLRAALGLDLPLRGLHARRRSESSATTPCRCSGGDRVLGWGNASVRDGRLLLQTKFADDTVRDDAFKRALADEKARMKEFLGL